MQKTQQNHLSSYLLITILLIIGLMFHCPANPQITGDYRWTWIHGQNDVEQLGIYGTQGIASPENVPGARYNPASWIDADGVLWLFGGSGVDSEDDLAVIKIQVEKEVTLHPATLGTSEELKIGQKVIAIGNPFGYDRTMTVGVVSGLNRPVRSNEGKIVMNAIQTDASINPGNSGGPLLNGRGEVIGINRMIYSNSGGSLGIGFAIPMNTARSILEQLKTHKKIKRGYIGVQIVPLTEEYAGQLGLKTAEGALIGGLEENGPAARAGVRVGDVIVKINDTAIKDYNTLVDIVGKAPIAKTLKATVWREGKEINLFITVGERP